MEDTSKNEILEAIGEFSNRVDQRLNSIEGDVASLKGEVMAIKSTMVTKDYLDDKLLNMKGDMVVMMRKEDEKVKTLVQILKEKSVLSDADVKIIFALEPFPNR